VIYLSQPRIMYSGTRLLSREAKGRPLRNLKVSQTALDAYRDNVPLGTVDCPQQSATVAQGRRLLLTEYQPSALLIQPANFGPEGDAVNREAQIATMLTVSFAVAFVGWAVVYLASAARLN
jgi:hypothetical protein